MFHGIKYIYFLRPNINNTYLVGNITHIIDIFDIHNFLTLIIKIFCVHMIKVIIFDVLIYQGSKITILDITKRYIYLSLSFSNFLAFRKSILIIFTFKLCSAILIRAWSLNKYSSLFLIWNLSHKLCWLWKTFRIITLAVENQLLFLESTRTDPKYSGKPDNT